MLVTMNLVPCLDSDPVTCCYKGSGYLGCFWHAWLGAKAQGQGFTPLEQSLQTWGSL